MEDQHSVPDMGISPYPSISGIEITLQGVINLLANCDSNKSPGPGKISPLFLKNTANEIALMLTHLFHQSLTLGTLSSTWNHAYVSPIFKRGNKSDPKNYRPVSLTSLICKDDGTHLGQSDHEAFTVLQHPVRSSIWIQATSFL